MRSKAWSHSTACHCPTFRLCSPPKETATFVHRDSPTVAESIDFKATGAKAGVAVGRGVVVVSDARLLRMPGGGDKAGKGKPPASRVPARYTRFSETPLKFEIRPGSQTVNLELTRFGGKEKTP